MHDRIREVSEELVGVFVGHVSNAGGQLHMVLTFAPWHDAVRNFSLFNETHLGHSVTQCDMSGFANKKQVLGCTSIGQNACLLINM